MNIHVIDPKARTSSAIYLAISHTDGKCDYCLLVEGTGDNLLREDRKEGYVDYINISTGTFCETEFNEEDGMMYMCKTLIAEQNGRLVYYVCNENVLGEIYDDLSSIKDVYVFCA